MKIKGTIGQYPIDLEIEGDIDYSKINELISHISEDHVHKQQWEANRAPKTFLSSPIDLIKNSTCIPLGMYGLLK